MLSIHLYISQYCCTILLPNNVHLMFLNVQIFGKLSFCTFLLNTWPVCYEM